MDIRNRRLHCILGLAISINLASGFDAIGNGHILVSCGNYRASSKILQFDTWGRLRQAVVPGRSGYLAPRGMTFGANLTYLFTCSMGDASVKSLRRDTGALQGNFVTPASGSLESPFQVVFHENGWLVSDQRTGAIKLYARGTGEYVADMLITGRNETHQPTDMEFGPDGNLYVCFSGTHCVNKYRVNWDTYDLILIQTIGVAQGMMFPMAICFDDQRKLYVCDSVCQRILRFNADGTFDKKFADFYFRNPCDIAWDTKSHILVADRETNKIYGFEDLLGLTLTIQSDEMIYPNCLCVARLPAVSIRANITLQDFVGNRRAPEIRLESYEPGYLLTGERWFEHMDNGGGFTVSTKDRGRFSFYAKASHWLSSTLRNVQITDAGAGPLDFSLINGDVDDSNSIDLADYAALAMAFGSVAGDMDWNEMADLDGDGEVTLADYSILAKNFGLRGD